MSNDAHNRMHLASSPAEHYSLTIGSPFHGQHYHSVDDPLHSFRHSLAGNAAMHGNYQSFVDLLTASSHSAIASQHQFPVHSLQGSGNWTWGQEQGEEKVSPSSGHDWLRSEASVMPEALSSDPAHIPSTFPLSQQLSPPGHLDASQATQSPGWASSHFMPSSTDTTSSSTSASPGSALNIQTTPLTATDISLDYEEEDDDSSEGDEDEDSGVEDDKEDGQGAAGSAAATGQTKKKVQRRQGVTCDQCRSKHVRCVNGGRAGQDGSGRQCERCLEKQLECTRNYAPPSRRYPRPSRTGKRIEQARMIHGTLSQGEGSKIDMMLPQTLSPQMLLQARPNLFASNPPIDEQLTKRVMGGCVSLRLLTSFFATAHMQMPIVDFHNFSARYNYSQGDARTMAVMANGGDTMRGIPSAKQSAPGLVSPIWPSDARSKRDQKSTLATAGSSETLIAVMHAWAALYTDMPIAFGGPMVVEQKGVAATPGSEGVSLSSAVDGAEQSMAIPTAKSASSKPDTFVMGANGKLRRPKRKQGVACDTCRLRRLRCDKLERPEGMGCSRCEDKRIVCTDDYIQSKRKKGEASSQTRGGSEGDDEEVGIVGSAPALARDVVQEQARGQAMGHASLEQQSWLYQGSSVGERYRFGRGRDALAYGKARQPFFQALLQKAIELVYKHRLMEEPSIEAIQTLMLLSQLSDLAKRREAEMFSEAACKHITTLRLESNYEVDERDRKAVEQILGNMQRRRLWCCVWTRDAIVSALYRQTPTFEAERALGIKGSAASRAAAPASHEGKQDRRSETHHQPASSVGRAPAKSSLAGGEGNAELNGEMGLSFSILALMQVGALSRFMSKHIDNITSSVEAGAPRQPSLHRTTTIPSFASMHKLTKACQALWKSIDSLLLFFDQCSLKARKNMDNLQPFQPLGWIATIKIGGAMLDLATFRSLAERLEAARTALQPLGDGAAMEDRVQVQSLRTLFDESRQRTLNSCRRLVKLVEFLLAKNVFQTGGMILRQLLPVTHFLAKMPPSVAMGGGEQQGLHHTHPHHHHLLAALHNTEALSSVAAQVDQAIDPRTLLGRPAASDQLVGLHPSSTGQDEAEDVKLGHVPESVFSSTLEPFDAARKRREVDICLEALAQLGYACPTMDVEMAKIELIMRAQQQ